VASVISQTENMTYTHFNQFDLSVWRIEIEQ